MTGTPWLDLSLWTLLGLMVGSFLNVVIYRLPKMLEQQWAQECAELAGKEPQASETFNLMVPRSRCPHCAAPIAWHQNIPVLSYLVLAGKCRHCKASIGWRYPAVELSCGLLFFYAAQTWGWSESTLVWSAFSAMLLVLAWIDWDTTLLPDDITLPLLWLGLVAAALQWSGVNLHSALWGAVAGYLSLWSIYWLFKLITGKEGMGYGDFKLFAALGAWFGVQALIPLILLASVLGAVVGIAMKFRAQLREGGYVPFGPFLAFAGLCALVLGPKTLQQFIGL